MKLDDTIAKIDKQIKKVFDAEMELDNEMEDLYEEIHKSEVIISLNPTFSYINKLGMLHSQDYIEFFGDDCKDYSAHRGVLMFDGYSIPYLYVHYDESYCRVYFPDDVLFKTPEEIRNFVKENTAKYNALAETRAKEIEEKLKQNEEYLLYLKLKKKFEQE